MPRPARIIIGKNEGTYHVISKIVGGQHLIKAQDKDYLMGLIIRYAKGFYANIQAFCIMSNHIHLQFTMDIDAADKASKGELWARYKQIFGKNANPPTGRSAANGATIRDGDEGVKRLRKRLGSVSQFVQEIKQAFSKYYNQKYDRKGYLWGERFKAVLLSRDEAELACSAYIDLNPVRAGLVKKPEEYRWSSLGYLTQAPIEAGELLTPLRLLEGRPDWKSWYRMFVYQSGSLEKDKNSRISDSDFKEVCECCGRLGPMAQLRYRLKYFVEGIVIGTESLVEDVQRRLNRRKIMPKAIFDNACFYTTQRAYVPTCI